MKTKSDLANNLAPMDQYPSISNQSGADGVATARMRQALQAFHEDEGAINTIEIILIVFVAVVLLIAILEFTKNTLWTKVKEKVCELVGC